MEEIWKDIEGFESYYQVSNFGKVRSLDRIIKNGETSTYLKRGMTLKQFVDSTGAYWMVSLVKNNKSSTKSVHRLVAKAFIPNPDNKPQVGHKDEKTLKNSGECNNQVDNLEWVTSKENCNAPNRVLKFLGQNNPMYNVHIKGKDNHSSHKVLCNGIMYDTVAECAKSIGVTTQTITKWVLHNAGCPEKYGVYDIKYIP